MGSIRLLHKHIWTPTFPSGNGMQSMVSWSSRQRPPVPTLYAQRVWFLGHLPLVTRGSVWPGCLKHISKQKLHKHTNKQTNKQTNARTTKGVTIAASMQCSATYAGRKNTICKAVRGFAFWCRQTWHQSGRPGVRGRACPAWLAIAMRARPLPVIRRLCQYLLSTGHRSRCAP